MSLRARLLLALGAVALLALLAADVATYSSLRSFLLSRIDDSLQATHIPIEQALTGRGFGPGFGGGRIQQVAPETFVDLLGPDGSSVVVLPAYMRGGQSFSPRLPNQISGFSTAQDPAGEPTVYFDAPSSQAGGPSFRVRASQIAAGYVLVLAEPLSETEGTLHRLLGIELAVTAGALLLAGVAGWWLVRVGLHPLADIEATAGAIAEGKLDERVPGESDRTEVGRLAQSLNVMLARIQDAFAARDTTEAELRRSEGRLRRFVADASHELRTPVAAVSAYAELFDRGADRRPDDLARVMTGIRAETTRMGQLVDDLLLLARMDEGRPLEQAPVELVGVAAEAVEAATAVGPDWPVRLVADGPVEVLGDAARLRQVLDNLLSNVRAHTPPGTRATVAITRQEEQAVCQVEDDGPGLPPDQAEKVFERFFRADPSRSRSSGGAGLGLSIVAAIVSAHGGTVDAAPRPEGGSVFTVRLPVNASAWSAGPVQRPA